jgi:NAD(P)-dependent dehydrogenase (short-subunit alcohol dehydrogenase family)
MTAKEANMPTFTFDHHVVLVTGGSTGIGAATALYFARAGAKVVITGRTAKTLDATAAQHDHISAVVADVSRPADAQRTIDEVRRRHGRLDTLVNNAGVAELAPLAKTDPEHFRRIFDINVGGVIELTRVALPLLEASRGSVVNIASTLADQPFANGSVYSASKAALVALTRSWAQELAPLGVRVNAVSPGAVETPIYDPVKMRISEEQLAAMVPAIVPLIPLARFGKPEEIAPIIAFLASPAASYVTGAQYHAGGGYEA